MSESNKHHPVLLKEAVEGLAIQPDGLYIDGTFGRGGHSQAILNQLKKGRLIAFDKDPAAIQTAKDRLGDDARFSIHHASFSKMSHVIEDLGLTGQIDGILLDLGISSPQVDNPERGFSFLKPGPLDMRMNPTQGESAADWINRVDEKKLAEVFKMYGEERFSKRIARAIIQARIESPITTTDRLAKIISEAHPKWEKHKHPATRCFQAIRIFINQELADLKSVLTQSLDILKTSGRLAVISFHSLEDRIVKQFIKDQLKGANIPKGLPITENEMTGRLKKVGKAIKPTASEIDQNPRARSAVLRIAEKIA